MVTLIDSVQNKELTLRMTLLSLSLLALPHPIHMSALLDTVQLGDQLLVPVQRSALLDTVQLGDQLLVPTGRTETKRQLFDVFNVLLTSRPSLPNTY